MKSARLDLTGILNTVTNYLGWQSLADEAAAAYKADGRARASWSDILGANAVTEMPDRLSRGVPVKSAIGLDPTAHETATAHFGRNINFTLTAGMGTVVNKGKELNGSLIMSIWRRIATSGISTSRRTKRCRTGWSTTFAPLCSLFSDVNCGGEGPQHWR